MYTNDPNGIMVEFCTTTSTFTAHDRSEAAALLAAAQPPLEAPPGVEFFEARDYQTTARP